MAGRRSLAVVTALLVLLAGCSAFGTGVPNSDSAGTTEAGVDASETPIYEPPLNTTEVAVDHVVALRKAGSFTYHSTVAISNPAMNATMEYGRIAHVEMDTGEMLVTRKDPGPGTQTIYLDRANNTTYIKTVEDSATVYNVTNGSFDTSRYAINGVPRFLDMFNLTYDGLTTLKGQEVYKYSADSPEQVASLSGVAGADSAKSISSIEANLYITKDGIIKQLDYSMVLETGEGNNHSINATTSYGGFGQMAVTPPSWSDDASALAQGEPRNVTRTITNETLGAELTLTADRTLFDRIRIIPGPGPLYKGEHTYEEAAASSAVTPLIPPSAQNATITVTYDESQVPEGGESELALYNYVATRNTWEVVNATQDTEANTFTYELPRSLALVVMHEPSWEETKSSAN